MVVCYFVLPLINILIVCNRLTHETDGEETLCILALQEGSREEATGGAGAPAANRGGEGGGAAASAGGARSRAPRVREAAPRRPAEYRAAARAPDARADETVAGEREEHHREHSTRFTALAFGTPLCLCSGSCRVHPCAMRAQTVRKRDLAQRLEIGRQSVTEYSNTIGQMRTIRDTLVRDIEALQLDYSVAAPTAHCSLRTVLHLCTNALVSCALL